MIYYKIILLLNYLIVILFFVNFFLKCRLQVL